MENFVGIFEQSEVAEILHLPPSRVKNWTIGRPLTITPSVKSATGTGSRNLYSVGDLYLFVLAQDLNGFGLVTRLIQQVLDRARGRLARNIALFVGGAAAEPRVELHPVEPCARCAVGHIGSPCLFCQKETAANLSLELLERLKEGAYLRELTSLITRADTAAEDLLRRRRA